MDINTLRKMRGANDFNKIVEQFERQANPESKGYNDDRFWKLEGDKAGNGSAVIRFLPRVEGDELPWVRLFSHGFQGPTGKWYIENSLTTLGEDDPVSELNSQLWNSGVESNREIARKQKRRLSFISNILVISDPKHPENEGKVFLFKYGKKIFDKLMDKARPTYEDEKPVNVFDLWEGADFKLRMRKKDGYTNYDDSSFMEPSALFNGDEEKLLKVVNQCHRLGEFTDRSNFKSYDELKRKLNAVLAGDTFTNAKAAEMESVDAPQMRSAPEPSVSESISDDDDEMLSYFKSIAEDD